MNEDWTNEWRKELLGSDIPVLLEFWAEWCGPCKTMAPILDELTKEMAGKVKILKCNIENNPYLIVEYKVKSVPTIIIFKDGKPQERLMGAYKKDALVKVLSKYTNVYEKTV